MNRRERRRALRDLTPEARRVLAYIQAHADENGDFGMIQDTPDGPMPVVYTLAPHLVPRGVR